MGFSSSNLITKAQSLGFNLVGITTADPSPTLDAYLRWVEQGMYAAMGYMARPDRIVRRQNLNVILPEARSIVLVGLDYHYSGIPESLLNDPSRGRIASYAWGMDYHDVITPRLEALAEWMHNEWQQQGGHRVYVDTGAVLERSHAQQAGLGFTGKNTMLINPRRGSRFFLGEIITTIEFDEYDKAGRETMCGSCTRCLNACPTDAFPQPHVLDARLCISYHTIENKGWIDRDLRPLFGNWIFGCDVCQDVCPFQRFSHASQEQLFRPVDMDRAAPLLVDLLQMDTEIFKARYHGTPIYRIGRKRLVRNACVAAGNWQHEQVIPYLIQLLYDDEVLVRGHAAWALWQIMGVSSARMLTQLYDREEDAILRGEIEYILG